MVCKQEAAPTKGQERENMGGKFARRLEDTAETSENVCAHSTLLAPAWWAALLLLRPAGLSQGGLSTPLLAPGSTSVHGDILSSPLVFLLEGDPDWSNSRKGVDEPSRAKTRTLWESLFGWLWADPGGG